MRHVPIGGAWPVRRLRTEWRFPAWRRHIWSLRRLIGLAGYDDRLCTGVDMIWEMAPRLELQTRVKRLISKGTVNSNGMGREVQWRGR